MTLVTMDQETQAMVVDQTITTPMVMATALKLLQIFLPAATLSL